MSSRQEEKERRRREREEREQAEARAQSRKKAFQIGIGTVLAIVALGAVALVALGSGKSSKVDTSRLAADATAAGCTFKSFKSEGRNHVTRKLTAKDFKTNPPTSGNHNPTPAADGVYAPGNEPEIANWVHTLEHGRIEYQYKPGASAADIAKLQALAQAPLNGTAGYHTLVFQNNSGMSPKFALVAWTHSLTCNALTPQSEQAMKDFRAAFTDKAPEIIP
ncbi:MAG: hypothetical protein JWO74_3638 [Solirubrobacterales bacterium]|jgi:hypothetical protein|nr:hypothetical protein [Solirubrobacterales bacterium]